MTLIRAVTFLVVLFTWQSRAVPPDSATPLLNFNSGTDRAERELILLDIREHHPEAGAALLKIAVETKDTETQWLAIRGLGWLKYDGAVPFLKASLGSASSYVRANSARALGEIHDVSAAPALIHILLAEQDNGVLEQTAVALEMLDAKEAIPALEARSNNPSAQTRLWIVGAVEVLGSKNVPFFARFLFDQNQLVAASAAHAMERITGRDLGFPHCGEGACSYGEGVENARRWWLSQALNHVQ